jgi:hypothetical protein
LPANVGCASAVANRFAKRRLPDALIIIAVVAGFLEGGNQIDVDFRMTGWSFAEEDPYLKSKTILALCSRDDDLWGNALLEVHRITRIDPSFASRAIRAVRSARVDESRIEELVARVFDAISGNSWQANRAVADVVAAIINERRSHLAEESYRQRLGISAAFS